jgi:hypothetical protein
MFYLDGKPVGFYDSYDMNARSIAERGAIGETQTFIGRNVGRLFGNPKDFNIYHGVIHVDGKK